jgi:hypothetical protein
MLVTRLLLLLLLLHCNMLMAKVLEQCMSVLSSQQWPTSTSSAETSNNILVTKLALTCLKTHDSAQSLAAEPILLY